MMLSSDKSHTELAAASFVDWWKLAGVDYDVQESPVNWLEPLESSALPVVVVEEQSPRIRPDIYSSQNIAPTNPEQWPDTIDGLLSAIRGNAPLPGNIYGGKSVPPILIPGAPLMIIGDVPDIEEVEAGQFGIGSSGRLLANMVKAIGFDLRDCSLTALASTRPATGELPDDDVANLAAFALHQVALAGPQHILLIGSVPCKALLGAELMDARISKPDVNHSVGKKAATPTFHPRTLLARPVLKTQAWKDLQMIAKKDAL